MNSEKQMFILNVIVIILLSIAFVASVVTAVIKFIELGWVEYGLTLFLNGLVTGISFFGTLVFTLIAIDNVKKIK